MENKELEEILNKEAEVNPLLLEQIIKDRKVMIEVTRKSFLYFLYIYFADHIKYPKAPFHSQMINIAQHDEIKRAVVMTFRDSAKSTILNTAFAIWSVVGLPEKKHIVIASQTQQRARGHLMNIRKEFEENQLLRENLGPFTQEDVWNSVSLLIPKYGSRITAISVEEGVRGLKERHHRPQLIIADDIEDSNSAKTKEGRDKTFNWFTGELLPLGEIDTKVVVLGNFLHPDSVCAKLDEMIKAGLMKGVSMKIPIIDDDGEITWKGKFTSMEVLEDFKKSIGNYVTWMRDFILVAVPDDFQLIKRESIKYYSKLPDGDFRFVKIGVDLAISEKETADFTAMIPVRVYGSGKDAKLYILPEIINKRMGFNDAVNQCKIFANFFKSGDLGQFLIEDVGYQRALPQFLKKEGIQAIPVSIGGQDKRARLALAASMIESGKILFPESGANTKLLVDQLVGFGAEKHDDLADALTITVIWLADQDKEPAGMYGFYKEQVKELQNIDAKTDPENKMYIINHLDEIIPKPLPDTPKTIGDLQRIFHKSGRLPF